MSLTGTLKKWRPDTIRAKPPSTRRSNSPKKKGATGKITFCRKISRSFAMNGSDLLVASKKFSLFKMLVFRVICTYFSQSVPTWLKTTRSIQPTIGSKKRVNRPISHLMQNKFKVAFFVITVGLWPSYLAAQSEDSYFFSEKPPWGANPLTESCRFDAPEKHFSTVDVTITPCEDPQEGGRLDYLKIRLVNKNNKVAETFYGKSCTVCPTEVRQVNLVKNEPSFIVFAQEFGGGSSGSETYHF